MSSYVIIFFCLSTSKVTEILTGFLMLWLMMIVCFHGPEEQKLFYRDAKYVSKYKKLRKQQNQEGDILPTGSEHEVCFFPSLYNCWSWCAWNWKQERWYAILKQIKISIPLCWLVPDPHLTYLNSSVYFLSKFRSFCKFMKPSGSVS